MIATTLFERPRPASSARLDGRLRLRDHDRVGRRPPMPVIRPRQGDDAVASEPSITQRP